MALWWAVGPPWSVEDVLVELQSPDVGKWPDDPRALNELVRYVLDHSYRLPHPAVEWFVRQASHRGANLDYIPPARTSKLTRCWQTSSIEERDLLIAHGADPHLTETCSSGVLPCHLFWYYVVRSDETQTRSLLPHIAEGRLQLVDPCRCYFSPYCALEWHVRTIVREAVRLHLQLRERVLSAVQAHMASDVARVVVWEYAFHQLRHRFCREWIQP